MSNETTLSTWYRDQLLTHAKRLCRNASDAEHLVQETFLRFARTIESGQRFPDEKVCAKWLVTTLHHLFVDLCRRRILVARAEQAPTITDAQFAQAVESLSPQVRALFEMHVRRLRREGTPIH